MSILDILSKVAPKPQLDAKAESGFAMRDALAKQSVAPVKGGSIFDILSANLKTPTPGFGAGPALGAAQAGARNILEPVISAKGKTAEADLKNYERGAEALANSQKTVKGVKLDASGIPIDENNLRKTGELLSTAESIRNAAIGAVAGPEQAVNEANKLAKAKSYISDLVAEQDLARSTTKPGPIQKLKNIVADAKTKFVDSNAPIEDTLSKHLSETGDTLLPSHDITNQIDRVYRAPTLAGQFMKDNGMVDIIKDVPDVNEFNQYLIAKHAAAVENLGKVTGRNLAEDKAMVEALAPTYEPYAQKVKAYSQALLDYTTNAGLISPELAANLKQIYPDYVPLERIFSEVEQPTGQFGSKAVASLTKQNVVQKLEGSTRAIEDPLNSLVAKTNDAFAQGEKNKTARILASYKDLEGNPFQITELKSGETAPATFSYLDNGVKRTFATTPDIAEAAKALNVEQMNSFLRIFRVATRLAKAGITGINPAFVAANVAKDQLTSIVMSDKALSTTLANPKNFVKSLFAAIGHNADYEELVRLGGGGTSFDIARTQVPQTLEKIRASRNLVSNVAYHIKNPSQLFRAVENVMSRSEELTRVQQYMGTKQALIKGGMSENEAAIAAARAARENTVNFARKGEAGNVMNALVLYLNANIQGERTFLRTIAARPTETAIKIGLTVGLPVSLLTAWNLSDPKRSYAYGDIQEWERNGNLIFVPPNPTKRPDGTWNVFEIPLPAELQGIASTIRRFIEASNGLDPVTTQDILTNLGGIVSPVPLSKGAILSGITPQLIKPSIEAATNKNLFTGYPIVSASEDKLSPDLQYNKQTSGTSRLIGSTINVSPAKIDAWIKGTLGGIGTNALHASDVLLAGLDIIPKDQIKGPTIIDSILARFMSAPGGARENRVAEQLKQALTDQADENLRVSQEAEMLHTEMKSLKPADANAKLAEIRQSNPRVFTKLQTIVADEKKGLTYNDRLIQSLTIGTGARAKFIHEYVKSLGDAKAKNAYIKSLQTKGIITAQVYNQLKILQKNDPQ